MTPLAFNSPAAQTTDRYAKLNDGVKNKFS